MVRVSRLYHHFVSQLTMRFIDVATSNDTPLGSPAPRDDASEPPTSPAPSNDRAFIVNPH